MVKECCFFGLFLILNEQYVSLAVFLSVVKMNRIHNVCRALVRGRPRVEPTLNGGRSEFVMCTYRSGAGVQLPQLVQPVALLFC